MVNFVPLISSGAAVMSGPTHSSRKIYFGEFELNLDTAEIRNNGSRTILPGQPFQVLLTLLDAPGELVTREELKKRLWRSDTFVDFDQSLNKVVNRLREALGDSAEKPRFIETLPRKGYRWIGGFNQNSRAEFNQVQFSAIVTTQRRLGYGTWLRTSVLLLLVGLCILMATWYFGWRRKELAVQSLTPVPVTALPGLADTPSLSPDGSRVAFSWSGDPLGPKGLDLYVKSVDSDDVLRLTRHAFDFVAPAWSPDGNQIAFFGSSKNESGLYLVQASGGGEKKLRSTYPSARNALSNIAWSGKTIAFADAPVAGGRQRLQLLSLETQQISQIEHNEKCQDEAMPAFSHDGKLLAYACYVDSGHFSFSIASSQGRSPHTIKELDGSTEGMTWSGDDKRLIFSHLQRGFPDDRLQEMSLSDGSVRELSFSAGAPLRDLPIGKDTIWPNIAASSGRLVYTMVSGGNEVTIWRTDLRQPHSPPIKLISSNRRQVFPQYSPDGKYIAFSSNRGGNSEIWMSDSAGQNLVQLSNLKPAGSVIPSWSPESRRIVFDSRKDGHSDLYILDIAERTPRKLNVGTMNASNPSWSHDGNWIYFVNGPGETAEQIYRVSPEGTHVEAITSAHGYHPLDSFGGTGVYFVAPPTTLEFATIKPTGTEYKVENVPPLAFYWNWTVGHDGIYFSPAGALNTLSYFDFAARKVRPILSPGKGAVFGVSVSPDGRYLLYTQLEDIHGDIMSIDDFH